MFYQKLLNWVKAFNCGNEEAIRYFTESFYLDEPFAVRLLLLYIFPTDEEFVLGYLDWILNQKDESVFEKCSNLGVDCCQELSAIQCKVLANFIRKWIAVHHFDNPKFLKKLSLEIINRSIDLYHQDPIVCCKNIQSLMPWIEPDAELCRKIITTKQRNIIIPIFFNWLNHLQAQPINNKANIDWSLLAFATEEDLDCLEDSCVPFEITLSLLNLCIQLDRTDLLARFFSYSQLDRLEVENSEKLKDLFVHLCHSQLSDHYLRNAYLYFRHNYPTLFDSFPKLLTLLVESNRIEFISNYISHFPISAGNVLRLWILELYDLEDNQTLRRLRQGAFFKHLEHSDFVPESSCQFLVKFQRLCNSETYFVNF